MEVSEVLQKHILDAGRAPCISKVSWKETGVTTCSSPHFQAEAQVRAPSNLVQ